MKVGSRREGSRGKCRCVMREKAKLLGESVEGGRGKDGAASFDVSAGEWWRGCGGGARGEGRGASRVGEVVAVSIGERVSSNGHCDCVIR